MSIILQVALGMVLGYILILLSPLILGLFFASIPILLFSSPLIVAYFIFPNLWLLWLTLEAALLYWLFKEKL